MPIIETEIRHFQNDDTVELQKKIIFMRTLSFLLNLFFLIIKLMVVAKQGAGQCTIASVTNV